MLRMEKRQDFRAISIFTAVLGILHFVHPKSFRALLGHVAHFPAGRMRYRFGKTHHPVAGRARGVPLPIQHAGRALFGWSNPISWWAVPTLPFPTVPMALEGGAHPTGSLYWQIRGRSYKNEYG